MWETPIRGSGVPTGSGAGGPAGSGDALGGAPDSTRPSNPWPRLLVFAFAVLTVVALAGVCVASFARPPKRELRIELATFSPNTPHFLPVTTFGADRDGFTYGAWVAVLGDGRFVALLSRDAGSLCHVRWEPTAQAGGRTGVFVDRCGAARYAAAGEVLDATAPRDLDAFPARLDGKNVVVDVTEVRLGACRAPGATVCSADGRGAVRRVPKGALPVNFGRE